MKMPKYLDRGTDGFHKSCLCGCVHLPHRCVHTYTHTHTHTRCASRFYEFRGECDAVNATGGEGTGYFVDWPLSHFSKSFLRIRIHAVCVACIHG